MRDGKKLLLSITMTCWTTPVMAASCFDVPATHWATEAIEEAAPIMQACRFNGDKLLTRRMAAEIAAALMDSQGIVAPAPAAKASLKDVDEDPAANAIRKVVGAGLMAGVGAGGEPGGDEFHADKPLTRLEMAKVVSGILRLKKTMPADAPPVVYSDLPENHWANAAVQHAVSAKVLMGYDGKFNGEMLINRYQTAVIIKKILAALK